MFKSLLTLLNGLLQLFQAHQRTAKKQAHEQRVQAIREDPVAQWNTRFGHGVPNDDADTGELSADGTAVTPRDAGRGASSTGGHDTAA